MQKCTARGFIRWVCHKSGRAPLVHLLQDLIHCLNSLSAHGWQRAGSHHLPRTTTKEGRRAADRGGKQVIIASQGPLGVYCVFFLNIYLVVIQIVNIFARVLLVGRAFFQGHAEIVVATQTMKAVQARLASSKIYERTLMRCRL